MNAPDLTVPNMLILAAHDLEARTGAPFSAEALVVAAWQKFPEKFGLTGYMDRYPDSNKVLASLMGEKGLRSRGWFIKTASKQYALTKEGRRIFRQLTGVEEEPEPSGGPERLPRELERFVADRLVSAAYRKFEEARKEELCFAHACLFWRIREDMTREQIDGALATVDKHLAGLERFCGEHDAQLTTGQVVTAGDVRCLTNIHHHLEDRFERHVNLLRSRIRPTPAQRKMADGIKAKQAS